MIEVFASGSRGNLYALRQSGDTLLIEAGLSFSSIKHLIGTELSGVSGCLISHEHGDHARALKHMLGYGVDCYASTGTIKATQADGFFIHDVKAAQRFDAGAFDVIPFEVFHDAAEPLGFLIRHKGTGFKTLYITDTYKVPYRFKGCHEIAVECNYDPELMEDSTVPKKVIERIKRNHFSLDNCKTFLARCDLRETKRITLIHLSERHADALRFRDEVAALTKKEVIIAR